MRVGDSFKYRFVPTVHLDMFLAAGVQRFFVQQLSVISVSAQLALGFGFFCPGKALQ